MIYLSFKFEKFRVFDDLPEDGAPFAGLERERVNLGRGRFEILFAKDAIL